MAKAHAPDSSHYYIPHDSPWPIRGSIALFAIMLGAIGYLNDWAGAWSFLPGAVLLAYMFFGWFSTVIGENQHGLYNLQVDRSFRMGMMWFIFSEVMFFAAFFGALFYARMLSVPWLGGEGVKVFSNFILWPQFEAVWPTNGPGHVGDRKSTRLNSSHSQISYAVFCLKKKTPSHTSRYQRIMPSHANGRRRLERPRSRLQRVPYSAKESHLISYTSHLSHYDLATLTPV